MKEFAIFYLIETDSYRNIDGATVAFTLYNQFTIKENDPRLDATLEHLKADLELVYDAAVFNNGALHADGEGFVGDDTEPTFIRDYTSLAQFIARIFKACDRKFVPPDQWQKSVAKPVLAVKEPRLPTVVSIAGLYDMTLHLTSNEDAMFKSQVSLRFAVDMIEDDYLFMPEDLLETITKHKKLIDTWQPDYVEFAKIPQLVIMYLSDKTTKEFTIKNLDQFRAFFAEISPLLARTIHDQRLKNPAPIKPEAVKHKHQLRLQPAKKVATVQEAPISKAPSNSGLFFKIGNNINKLLGPDDVADATYEFWGEFGTESRRHVTFHIENSVLLFDDVENLQHKLKLLQADLNLANYCIDRKPSKLSFNHHCYEDSSIHDYSTLSDALEDCLATFPINPPQLQQTNIADDGVFLQSMAGGYECVFERIADRYRREPGENYNNPCRSKMEIKQRLEISQHDGISAFADAIEYCIRDLQFAVAQMDAWQPDDVDFYEQSALAILSDGSRIEKYFIDMHDFKGFVLQIMPYLQATLRKLRPDDNAEQQDEVVAGCGQRLMACLS